MLGPPPPQPQGDILSNFQPLCENLALIRPMEKPGEQCNVVFASIFFGTGSAVSVCEWGGGVTPLPLH